LRKGELRASSALNEHTAAAEIATLRQELMAAKARIQETGRHNATEAEHFRAICQGLMTGSTS
jgi:hypothetical protein